MNEENAELNRIRQKARARHEEMRLKALKRGRKDFPLLPYECSWAFELAFKRRRK